MDDVREELLNELCMAMIAAGAERDIRQELYIILDGYEIAQRVTELAVRDEDRNDELINRFLIAKTVKGCTERTIRFYKESLIKILDSIGKTVTDITADDIRLYIAKRVRRDGVSKTTAGNEERALSSFMTWLRTEEIIIKNPMDKVDRIRKEKKQKKAFTEYEIEKIRSACRSQKETAIIEIMLSTGCRCGELVLMKRSDVRDDHMVVHGKGEKDRTVYFTAKAQLALEKYLAERSDAIDWIFPLGIGVCEAAKKSKETKSMSMRRDWYKCEDLLVDDHTSIASIEALVRKIGRDAGVENTHPHRFRRTCATMALRRGMPIEQVSKMLGHEQLSTTQVYLDLNEDDFKMAHNKYVV